MLDGMANTSCLLRYNVDFSDEEIGVNEEDSSVSYIRMSSSSQLREEKNQLNLNPSVVCQYV